MHVHEEVARGAQPAVAAQDEHLVGGLRELVLRLLHDGRGRVVAAERKGRGVAGGGVEGEVEGAWVAQEEARRPPRDNVVARRGLRPQPGGTGWGGGEGAASGERGGSQAAPELAAAGRRLNLRVCERGCGSEPAHSLMDHSFFSTESTCTSL